MNQLSSLREELETVSWMLTGNRPMSTSGGEHNHRRAPGIKRETLKTTRLQHQLQAA
jgi:hypothetical protein